MPRRRKRVLAILKLRFVRRSHARWLLVAAGLLAATCRVPGNRLIDVKTLLGEMVDLGNLSQKPAPFFKQAMASSYSRESLKGGDA
jgi:hypothetical protein